MKKIVIFSVAVLAFTALTIFSCYSERLNKTSDLKPKLLFSSGFEGGVYIDAMPIVNFEDYRFIRGVDNQTGHSWPISILGSRDSALHYV